MLDFTVTFPDLFNCFRKLAKDKALPDTDNDSSIKIKKDLRKVLLEIMENQLYDIITIHLYRDEVVTNFINIGLNINSKTKYKLLSLPLIYKNILLGSLITGIIIDEDPNKILLDTNESDIDKIINILKNLS